MMESSWRELIFAMQDHPNAKFLLNEGTILLSTGENIEEIEIIRAEIESLLDNTKLLLEFRSGQEIKNHCDRLNQTNVYQAAILSNVFSSQNIINDKHKIAELISSVLLRMADGGIFIVHENLEEFGAKQISELTKYFDLFATSSGDRTLGFNFYGMTQIQNSINAYSNFLDVYWILSKSSDEKKCLFGDVCSKTATFREFLDKTQYTEDNVSSYEWIFGENFISPGGISENRRVLNYLKKPLRPGQKMLDIGVGIGGGARQAAKEFGLYVRGCDLSSNMIQHAFDRNQIAKDHRVHYQIADAMVFHFEANSYDIVFSRDCIQHISDTTKLFRNIFTWLKPGGQMLLTMYGRGNGTLSEKFIEYVRKRQYMLRTLDEFRDVAKKCGFTNIFAENMTNRFRQILETEREHAISNKKEFVQKFGQPLYDSLIAGWEDKITFIDEKNQNWLLLRAEKPFHYNSQTTEAGA